MTGDEKSVSKQEYTFAEILKNSTMELHLEKSEIERKRKANAEKITEKENNIKEICNTLLVKETQLESINASIAMCWHDPARRLEYDSLMVDKRSLVADKKSLVGEKKFINKQIVLLNSVEQKYEENSLNKTIDSLIKQMKIDKGFFSVFNFTFQI